MSPKENPFTPRDMKRRVLICAAASFAFVLVASIAGVVTELNPFITILVGIGGGGILAFALWQRV